MLPTQKDLAMLVDVITTPSVENWLIALSVLTGSVCVLVYMTRNGKQFNRFKVRTALSQIEKDHVAKSSQQAQFLTDIGRGISYLSFCTNDLRYYLATKHPLKLILLFLLGIYVLFTITLAGTSIAIFATDTKPFSWYSLAAISLAGIGWTASKVATYLSALRASKHSQSL